MRISTASEGSSWAVASRLAGAEFLKVRKRRGLVAWAVLLTIGAVVAAGGVLAALHATDPAKYGPAGGRGNLANAAYLLSVLGTVAAVLDRLIPAGLLSGARPDRVSATMPLAAAAAVVTAWELVPLAAGAWRTSTRDA
jgi:hypothetical protein